MTTTNEIPRRSCVDRFTPAEKAIRDALLAVEAAGCDVRLTKAVTVLADAQAWVADYVDGVPVEEHYPRSASAPSPSRDQGTSDDLAEWERLANEATPGPWRTEGPGNGWGDHITIEAAGDADGVGVIHAWETEEWRRDATFIAAAREAVPALIALVRSERSARAEAERERDEARAEADLYRRDSAGRMTAAEHRAREMAQAAADAIARADAAERRAEAAERARDEAVRAGLESTRAHEADLLRWASERDALRDQAYRAEHRAITAEARPCVENCMQERSEGNGGCGACALCCKEWRSRAEAAEAAARRAPAAPNDKETQR